MGILEICWVNGNKTVTGEFFNLPTPVLIGLIDWSVNIYLYQVLCKVEKVVKVAKEIVKEVKQFVQPKVDGEIGRLRVEKVVKVAKETV